MSGAFLLKRKKGLPLTWPQSEALKMLVILQYKDFSFTGLAAGFTNFQSLKEQSDGGQKDSRSSYFLIVPNPQDRIHWICHLQSLTGHHPRISSSILPNLPHSLSSWITFFTQHHVFLNSYIVSAHMRQEVISEASLLVYFCPVASVHLPPRAMASCFPITHANSKHFSGFPWFSPSFLANSPNPTSPLPPKFVQCCSETAKEQSAKPVHQLHRNCKVMSPRRRRGIGGGETEEKKEGKGLKYIPFKKNLKKDGYMNN